MRMRTAGKVLGIAVVMALSLTGTADAQGLTSQGFQNWNFLGSGARARGMGGAFLGVSDDGTAASWNPAGLIYNEGIQLTMNYSRAWVNLGLDNTPAGQATNVVSLDNSISNLSDASFVAPLTMREHEFYVSAYYNRVQDVFARGQFAVDDVRLPVRLGTPFSATFEQSGNIAYVGGGFGTVIAPNLTFGFNLNLVTGDGVEAHNMMLDSTRYSSLNPAGDVIDSIIWVDKSDIDYSGLNYSIGMMYRTDRWSAGMVFTPSWTLTENLDYFGERTLYSSGTPIPSLGIVPGPDGTNREIVIPFTAGLGTSYHISENFMVVADYQFRAFKREGQLSYEDDPVTPDSPMEKMNTKWYNLHQIRLGMEFMKETDWGIVPLRLGVRNDPRLIGDQKNVLAVFDQRSGYYGIPGTENDPRPITGVSPRGDYFLPLTAPGATGDQINPITLTVGSGIHWTQIHLDFALEFTGFEYNESGFLRMIRIPTGSSGSTNDPRLNVDQWGIRATDNFGSYSRTYKDDRVRFSLHFTGYF